MLFVDDPKINWTIMATHGLFGHLPLGIVNERADFMPSSCRKYSLSGQSSLEWMDTEIYGHDIVHLMQSKTVCGSFYNAQDPPEVAANATAMACSMPFCVGVL